MSDAITEFDRQLDHLVALGHPELTATTEESLREGTAPLRDVVAARPDAGVVRHDDHIPFVPVPSGDRRRKLAGSARREVRGTDPVSGASNPADRT